MGGRVRLAWHGGASLSLRLAGLEVLVDPAFSRPGDYPSWFDRSCANPHAPTVAEYLAAFRPEYLFITHGHFDHFDLETVTRLAAALTCPIVGSAEVLAVCRDRLGLAPDRLLPCPAAAGSWLELGAAGEPPAARVRAVPGPHWFTGAEGEAVARAFAGRPERYGAMPCGGPMLGYLFEVPAQAGPAGGTGTPAQTRAAAGKREAAGERAGSGAIQVYVSGDTEPAGLPAGPFDVAVVSCGGELWNPAAKRREPPYLDEPTLADAALRILRPGILVPVHYDHPVFLTPFDPAKLEAALAASPGAPRLVVPPYNRWVTLVG